MASNEQGIPSAPTFLTLVLKTFAGLGGGIAGMLILLIIALSAAPILKTVLDTSTSDGAVVAKHPLFIFVVMAMIFLTSLGSNIIGSLFFSFVQHEKYGRASTSIYQIFAVNLVIFVIMAPIYILLNSSDLIDLVAVLAGFHVLISAITSVMIMEIIGNTKYALVGVYGLVFSMLISTGMTLLVFQFSGRRPEVVLFSALPILWTTLGFVSVIVEMLYHWLYTIYGTDFLMTRTDYGADYGEPEPEEKPLPPDVSGADFLKK